MPARPRRPATSYWLVNIHETNQVRQAGETPGRAAGAGSPPSMSSGDSLAQGRDREGGEHHMSDRPESGRSTLGRPPSREDLHSQAQGRFSARVASSRQARHRKLALIICGAMSAVVLLVAGGAWGLTGYINDTIKRVNAGTSGSGTTGPLNILVAGVDQRAGLSHHQEVVLHVGNDVSTNSDTLMLLHVSADRSRVTMVSIPRDSWVNIPGHGMSKINAAYGLGGAKLMGQTVEQAP